MSLTVRFDKYSQSTGKPLRQKNNPFKLTIEKIRTMFKLDDSVEINNLMTGLLLLLFS